MGMRRYYCASCMVWSRQVKNELGFILMDQCPLCHSADVEIRGCMDPKVYPELDANESFVKFILCEDH